MDPDKALQDLRGLVAEAHKAHDTRDDCGDLCEWAESFEALDEWLSRGGFLPAAWSKRNSAGPRIAWHSDESFFNRTTDCYNIVAITEGEAGYEVVDFNASLSGAKEIARKRNEEAGLSSDDVLNIRTSSMAAHNDGQTDV